MPVEVMMSPGTMKDKPHAVDTKAPAIRDPRMFPTDVWEFHTPMIKPRLGTNTQGKTWRKHCLFRILPFVLQILHYKRVSGVLITDTNRFTCVSSECFVTVCLCQLQITLIMFGQQDYSAIYVAMLLTSPFQTSCRHRSLPKATLLSAPIHS